MKRLLLGLVLLALLAWSPTLCADTVAASLYEEGVALLKRKNFEEACKKLDASFKREPLSGTLMTLAQCHQLRGMTATAWDEYQRAAGLAQTEGRGEYEAKAKELAAKLEPNLSRLKLELAADAQHEGLTVTLAGGPVDPATLGVALALDPGDYEVEVSAPGYEGWSTKTTVDQPGQTVTVTIPALQPAATAPEVAPPTPEPVAVAPPTPPAAQQQPSDAADHTSQDASVPAWAWVLGAGGLVMGGVAVGFLVDDLAAIGELRDRCEPDPNGGADDYLCDDGYDADADNDRKNLSGPLALGFGIGAVVALTASIIGIATASGDAPTEARLEVVPLAGAQAGGLMLEGRF